MPRPLPFLVLSTALAAVPSCRYAIHHVQDLPYERTVVIELVTPEVAGFRVESMVGDVRLVGGAGPARIVAVVHERAPNLAQVWFEDGAVRLAVLDRDDAYLGEVTLEAAEVLGAVEVGAGAGDVSLEGLVVAGDVSVTTGAGDVRLRGIGSPPRIEVSTGAGDASVEGVDAQRIELSTGAGDLRLANVWSDAAELDTGVGTIRVENSTVGDLRADTGVGDIHLVGTQTEREVASTGIGSIHR